MYCPWTCSFGWCLAEGCRNGDQRHSMDHCGSGWSLAFSILTSDQSITDPLNIIFILCGWLLTVVDNEVRAAIRIQSLWRGYHARQRHPDVVRTRYEMQSRRSEEHILELHRQLNRYYSHFVSDQLPLIASTFPPLLFLHYRPFSSSSLRKT